MPGLLSLINVFQSSPSSVVASQASRALSSWKNMYKRVLISPDLESEVTRNGTKTLLFWIESSVMEAAARVDPAN